MRRRVLAVAIVAVAVAALVCGLGGWGASRLLAKLVGPQPRYDLAALQRQPEAGLVAPGATRLRQLGGQGSGGSIVFGSKARPAMTGSHFGTAASVGEVEAYYERELLARGWQRDPSLGNTLPPDTLREVAWRKGGLIFRLTIFRDDPRAMTPTTREYPTFFGAVLTEDYPKR